MSERPQDLLAWAERLSGRASIGEGGLITSGPWGWTLRRGQEPLDGGWWRVRADGATGPVDLEMRRIGSAHTEFLTLPPGRWRALRLEPGVHEARLWGGEGAGRVASGVRLEPAPLSWLIPARAARGWRTVLRLARARLGQDRRASDSIDTGFGAPLDYAEVASRHGVEVVLDAGDRLADDAFDLGRRAFDAHPGWLAIVADEIIGGRLDAKPEWDPDHALTRAYANRAVLFRRGHRGEARDVEGVHERLLEIHRRHGPRAIGRLPLVVLASEGASADLIRMRSIVSRHLAESEADPPRVWPRADGLGLEIDRATPGASACLIIPTRDRPDLLDRCLASVLEHTRYPDYRIIVVDNGSQTQEGLASLQRWAGQDRVTVLRRDEPFNFARLCNAGAVEARDADLLVFLNDDIETAQPEWLSILAAEATRPEVGAVGPLLTYPDGTVQHAGLALGLLGHAGHPWRGVQPESEPRVMLGARRAAVTGACLIVRASSYAQAGGMDETVFPVTFNDVDLCLRLDAVGLRTIYQPQARLTHWEGQTRRPDHHPDNLARRGAEVEAFLDRWGEAVADDPSYSPALTRADESARRR